MMMGAGLLSKFVELVAGKLIGKRLDIALDDKRRACYSFVELLSILKGLYTLTTSFIEELEAQQTQPCVIINLIVVHRRTIGSLTSRFFELNDNLFLTLQVLDPALAEIFEQIHLFKGSLFYSLADSITIPEEEPRNQSVLYRHPSERVLALDLEQFYQSLRSHRAGDADRPWMWPDELVEVAEWEAAFPSIQFHTEDKKKLAAFVNDLRNQANRLNTAIEQLRVLIKDNFTLDEVLASSNKLPRG